MVLGGDTSHPYAWRVATDTAPAQLLRLRWDLLSGLRGYSAVASTQPATGDLIQDMKEAC
jgi:hypothetical protein